MRFGTNKLYPTHLPRQQYAKSTLNIFADILLFLSIYD